MTATLRYAMTIFVIVWALVQMPLAAADECIAEGEGVGDYFEISGSCDTPPVVAEPPEEGVGASPDPYVKYQWASTCAFDPDLPPPDLECPAALTCADPKQRLWQLWGQLPNGSWRVIRSQCFGGTPPAYEPPQVTPAMVLSALRRVGLPSPSTHVQPRGKTLVNFDTIFHTDPRPVNLTLTILRQAVEVEARPTSYHWFFGDGQGTTTDSPGEPYPSKEITHRYLEADVTVRPHVEAVYSARFRVSGGAWEDIGETVTSVGPTTDLRVVEGTPLLSGDRG